jgi:hypothetical protein
MDTKAFFDNQLSFEGLVCDVPFTAQQVEAVYPA